MADDVEIKMVVIDGVRYRPEDAPGKKPDPEPEGADVPVGHKMRTPRKASSK